MKKIGLEETPKETAERIRTRINAALLRAGPYSHNIIGLCLSEADQKLGKDTVKELFAEFDLAELGYPPPSP